jgi:hypothetical protein
MHTEIPRDTVLKYWILEDILKMRAASDQRRNPVCQIRIILYDVVTCLANSVLMSFKH